VGDASGIARVTVRVSAGDGPAFSPVTVELAESGDQWFGRIAGIPVGQGRRFDAVGWDAAQMERLAGFAVATVQPGAATVVVITLSAASSGVTIDSVSWFPAWVQPLGVVQMAVTAHGQDALDTVSYSWSADCGAAGAGVFGTPTSAETSWTAPGVAAVCHISIRVTTSRGMGDESDFTVPVVGAGNVDAGASENLYPVIEQVSALVRLGSTMEVELAVEAIDPDGDALTYRWTSDGPDGCLGISFDLEPPYSPAMPRASLPPPATTCKVQVTVSDGRPEGTVATIWLPPGRFGGP
jgi:hypothetical protein